MAVSKKVGDARQWVATQIKEIWKNILKDGLWKRMIKNIFAVTLAIVLCLIHPIANVWGKTAYLAPIAMLFGHPGRRLGMVVESLALIVLGCIVGVPWTLFGVWLGSLAMPHSIKGAFTIRAIFLGITTLIHGYLRSRTPRLFIFTVFFILIAAGAFTSTAMRVTKPLVTQNCYPVLCAVGLSLLINILLFPEFSSEFIGRTTMDMLDQTRTCLQDAESYFIRASDGSTAKNTDATKIEAEEQPNSDTAIERESEKNKGEKSDGSLLSRLKQKIKKIKGKSEKDALSAENKNVSLEDLTEAKKTLRKSMELCKTAQSECLFELAFSHVPPARLKPISVVEMDGLVGNTLALIGACESKFSLMGDDSLPEDTCPQPEKRNSDLGDASQPQTDIDTTDAESSRPETPISGKKGKSKKKKDKGSATGLVDLQLVKPVREIQAGDPELLRILVRKISEPLTELREVMNHIITVISSSIGYAYDVPSLPTGTQVPSGILIEEIDVYLEILEAALANFDKRSSAALKGASVIRQLTSKELDIMPREEIFLISSFILNLRQAGSRILAMLESAKGLVEERNKSSIFRRFYFPDIEWRKWLFSGGSDDESLPVAGRKPARQGTGIGNEETGARSKSPKPDDSHGIRRRLPFSSEPKKLRDPENAPQPASKTQNSKSNNRVPGGKLSIAGTRVILADFIDWMTNSEDLLYAFKLMIAVYLLSFPAFVSQWNSWYYYNRGIWAVFQLIYVTEVSIGTTVITFTFRAIGTTIGCAWGYFAYVAKKGDPYVASIIACIGIIPFVYIQLGTKYIKVGQVSMVSLAVVLLATELVTVPGTATQNFFRRTVAFLIGSVAGLVMELVFIPVKARTRMVESIATAIDFISKMEACIAHGIEDAEHFDVQSEEMFDLYDEAAAKAKAALGAAETFHPFTTVEPRLKGSFESRAKIYEEIIFILHQIIDRMDNMVELRKSLGSEVLEEYNSLIFPYRRDLAASITVTLFAAREGLTTKSPLPQFVPSARIAQLRMINRVREVVTKNPGANKEEGTVMQLARTRAVRRKFLAWNAGSAAQIEIVEYLEELIDLVKLLVGADEFRSGILTRSKYSQYVRPLTAKESPEHHLDKDADAKLQKSSSAEKQGTQTQRPRGESNKQLPDSLQRIHSRRQEARLERQRTKSQ